MCRRHCLICVAAIAFTTSQSQSHPVSVIWHGPIQGGVLSGVSSETVSFLLPLAAARDVHLYHHDGFRNASKFVASLPLHMQRGLRDMRDRNPTMDEVGRSLFRLTRRCVSVSSWDPGYYYMKLLPVLKQMTMHAMPRASAMERRRRCAVVGRLMFETSLLPRAWIPALRELDEIWVPSTFMREIVERDLVEEESLTCSAAAAQSESCTAPRSAIPVRVLHEPLDTQRWFNPELHDRAAARLHFAEKAGCPHDARIFLSVFKWERRKAMEVLLAAFDAAFANEADHEKVCLLLRTTLPHGVELQRLRSVSAHQPVVATVPPQPGLNYSSLFAASDCFVLASHGEGWGRTLVEGMAMGLLVIGTDWGGATEFLTARNSLPLPVRSLESAATGGGGVDDVFDRQDSGRWATIDQRELQARLRRVLEMPAAERLELMRNARADATKYDNAAVGKELLRLLHDVAEPKE